MLAKDQRKLITFGNHARESSIGRGTNYGGRHEQQEEAGGKNKKTGRMRSEARVRDKSMIMRGVIGKQGDRRLQTTTLEERRRRGQQPKVDSSNQRHKIEDAKIQR